MNRYEARTNAFCLIFSAAFQKETDIDELLALYIENEAVEHDEFFESLVKTTHQNLQEIDATIEMNLNNWSLSRISKVSLAVLRLGVCELKYFTDTPKAVVMNEAVELAKKYEGKDCGRFVNGVLSAVCKEK